MNETWGTWSTSGYSWCTCCAAWFTVCTVQIYVPVVYTGFSGSVLGIYSFSVTGLVWTSEVMFLSGSDKLPLTENGKLSMHKCSSCITVVLRYFTHYHVTLEIAWRITFSRLVHIRFNCFCEKLVCSWIKWSEVYCVRSVIEFACQFVCLQIVTMPYTFL